MSASYPLRAKEGGKNSFPRSLALRHQSLAFRTRLCTKNEAPEAEAEGVPYQLLEWMLGRTGAELNRSLLLAIISRDCTSPSPNPSFCP